MATLTNSRVPCVSGRLFVLSGPYKLGSHGCNDTYVRVTSARRVCGAKVLMIELADAIRVFIPTLSWERSS